MSKKYTLHRFCDASEKAYAAVVYIVENDYASPGVEGLSKRNTWRLGKVVKLIQAKDERCRAAVVKTFDGNNHQYIRRPIEKLYPTEIKSAEPVTTEEETSASCTTSENNTVSLENSHKSRPIQAAAEKGIARRRMEGQS